jgi:hypothetical protein
MVQQRQPGMREEARQRLRKRDEGLNAERSELARKGSRQLPGTLLCARLERRVVGFGRGRKDVAGDSAHALRITCGARQVARDLERPGLTMLRASASGHVSRRSMSAAAPEAPARNLRWPAGLNSGRFARSQP